MKGGEFFPDFCHLPQQFQCVADSGQLRNKQETQGELQHTAGSTVWKAVLSCTKRVYLEFCIAALSVLCLPQACIPRVLYCCAVCAVLAPSAYTQSSVLLRCFAAGVWIYGAVCRLHAPRSVASVWVWGTPPVRQGSRRLHFSTRQAVDTLLQPAFDLS